MRRSHRDCALMPSAAEVNSNAGPDLFRMLLPNAHTHVPKGKAVMWERHHQQQHSWAAVTVTTPTRPQTPSRSAPQLALSPRSPLTTTIKSPVLRCKRADPSNSPRRAKLSEARPVNSGIVTNHQKYRFDEPTGCDPDQAETTDQRDEEIQLPLNIDARGHLEMRACMLAHVHRIDVNSLQQMREKATHDIGAIKTRQLLSRGGLLDDGSLLETTKRKTSFLLRHFFALGDSKITAGPTQQDEVLYDVIDEWTCRENASPDDIAGLWKSIQTHLEHSYMLRRQLVPKSDPDGRSITIAMDCLRRLPARLPAYRRMLDVIITLIETGLYHSDSGREEDSNSDDFRTKPYYFDQYRRLHEALDKEITARQTRETVDAQIRASRIQSPSLQLQTLLGDIETAIQSGTRKFSDKESLLASFFQSDVDGLMSSALQMVLRVAFDSENPRLDQKRLFYDHWMPLLQAADVQEVLTRLTSHHIEVFQSFILDNFDAVDKLLMETSTKSTSTSSEKGMAFSSPVTQSAPKLFQQLIERHPAQFASVLWTSPFLTAHVFQGSHHLIGRILEQNIVVISQVLQQRADVLTAMLNHTLRDNSAVMEEFLLNHPKAFSDLLVNKSAAVAAAVKSDPSILADILQVSRPTLAKVLLSMPELLCHLFKSTPDLLAQTLREDLTILPLAFSMVPQCLCDTLERHPEYFIDVAHRKPALVAKLFAKYPDLLLDPLEAHPSVFSNFLAYHRKILPDFFSPSFDPKFFQLERKQFADSGQQTDKRMCKYDGHVRLREKIKFQEDAQLQAIRQTMQESAVLSSGGRYTPSNGGRSTPNLGGERALLKDSKAAQIVQLPPTPEQVVSEITRIYMKKLEVDARSEAMGKKRRPLADFVLDMYIQELGFKRKAQTKIAFLLTGAKQTEQESLRIKWFLKFMNSYASTSSTLSTASSTAAAANEIAWSYHPLASDFYLAAAQYLVALPIDQLQQRLEEELLRPCLVGYTRVKQFLEDPMMTRILPSGGQRQQLLTAICEKENLIHGATGDATVSSNMRSPATVVTLHLEDMLESLMLEWSQHLDKICREWTMQYQLVNPDGSGVVRYNVFADLVRAKFPSLEDRAILKIYHQCGEDNDLGEYLISVDDFSLAMSILQEQAVFREYADRNAPKTPGSSSVITECT